LTVFFVRKKRWTSFDPVRTEHDSGRTEDV
jgi:hypothetical protein